MALPWNDGSVFQFSAPLRTHRNPRKRATGKIRTRWLGKNMFNLIKTRRPNTPETKVTDLDKINTDIKAQLKHVTDLDCHALTVSRMLCILHPKIQTGPAKTRMGLKLKQRKRLTY